MPTHHILYGIRWSGLTGHVPPVFAGLEQARAAGFRIVEAQAEFWADQPFAKEVVHHGLIPIVQGLVATPEDLQTCLRLARETGALLVNAHAGTPQRPSDEAAAFINRLYDMAETAGVRLVLESRSGCLMQNQDFARKLLSRVPRLAINLDVSHDVVATAEMGITDDLMPRLDPLLDRTQKIHGRISIGQTAQDAGSGATRDFAQLCVSIWTETMRRWRSRARPGSAFVFTTDPGPPATAGMGTEPCELADRWALSAAIRTLGAEAWASSAKPAT